MRHVLTPHGTLLIPGGETSGRVLAGFDRQLRALLLSRFVGQNLTTLVSSQNHKYLIVLTWLIDAGQITPVIDRTYPLSETTKAIQYVEDGHARSTSAPATA